MARKEVVQYVGDQQPDLGLSAERELLVPEAGIRTRSGDPLPLPAGVDVTGAVEASGAVTGATIVQAGANGQAATIASVSALLSALEGATVEAEDLIPAGSLVLGVTTRVTTVITGATSYSVGDGTDADRWGATIAVTAGTTSGLADITIASPVYYAAATSVVLTAAGSDFTAGAVRVTVHYIALTAATS